MEFVAGDALFVHVELLEDSLGEQAPSLIRGLAVQLLEVVQEVESGFEVGDAGFDLVVGGFELSGELGALLIEAVEVGTDLGLGELSVGGEVDEVGFLDVETGDLGLELVVEELGGSAFVGHGLVEQVTELAAEGWL